MSGEWLHRRIEDALVLPYLDPMIGSLGRTFRGGPVIDGEEWSALRHCMGRMPVDAAYVPDVVPETLAGEYVYAGPVYEHFGHYMSEMVHRFVPAMVYGTVHKWVTVTTASDGRPGPAGFPSFVQRVLDFLGIPLESITVISRPTRVEALTVWQQGSDLGGGPIEPYLDLLTEFSNARLDALHARDRAYGRVFVSRSEFVNGVHLGYGYLEEQLAREGFAVIQPETLPFSRQMDIYRKADVVVFPEGSAVHGTELLGRSAINSAVLIARRPAGAQILEAVLRPRAGHLTVLGDSGYLGSAYADEASGLEFIHLGVAFQPAEVIVPFLRETAGARLAHFDEKAYRARAKSDLMDYLLGVVQSPSWYAHPERIPDVVRAFA